MENPERIVPADLPNMNMNPVQGIPQEPRQLYSQHRQHKGLGEVSPEAEAKTNTSAGGDETATNTPVQN